MTTALAPDWILKQALEAQRKANSSWLNGKPELDDGGLTMTVIGCGTMGTAILKGVLQNYEQPSSSNDTFNENPTKTPSKFNVCVRTSQSADRIKAELQKYNARIKVFENDNLGSAKAGDVILLGCKPQQLHEVLRAQGIREALAGKLLISVCAGVTEARIYDILYEQHPLEKEAGCKVVRAMPNTAAAIGESMTVISTPARPLPEEARDLTAWIFTRIGRVRHVPESSMDACTALCGSGPAFIALMAEALVDGAIAMGIPREEAYVMAAQTMRGTAGLLSQGEHPTHLRDKVSTPGGCTVSGIEILEKGMFRDIVAQAVKGATATAGQVDHKISDVPQGAT